jgi:hypothetical protein
MSMIEPNLCGDQLILIKMGPKLELIWLDSIYLDQVIEYGHAAMTFPSG